MATYKQFSWDVDANASRATNMITQTLGFNNGYEQRVSYGINNTRLLWDCSVTNRKTVIDSIHEFLTDHRGVTPFYVTIDGKKSLYMTDGDLSTSHVGHDVWSIGFKIKQVFMP